MRKLKTDARWLSAEEAMDRLECSRNAFLRLVYLGRITARDFGHRRYWAEDVTREATKPIINQEQSA